MQGLSPAPATYQVQQCVNPPEALEQRRAPGAGRFLLEQVDRAPVPALGGESECGLDLVDPLLRHIGPGDSRPARRETLRDHGPKPAGNPSDRDYPVIEAAHMGETGFEPV